MNPRRQGDIGERAAAAWLLREGHVVAYPFGHSPDWDLVAEIDHTLYKIQVKTTTVCRNGRWEVTLCTKGGNQSWNRVSKLIDPTRFDYLFVLARDGRQWFMPARQVAGGSGIVLGGPKYSAFEIETGPPIEEYERRAAARSSAFATPVV